MIVWFPELNRKSVTGSLLIINIVVFFLFNFLPQDISYYFFISQPWTLSPWTILSNFSHAGLFHLLANMYLLYMLWPMIEMSIGKNEYIKLIIFMTLFTSAWWYFLYWWPTLGFSWLALWLISFAYFSDKVFIPKQQLGILLFLNILIWLSPWISFFGHALWALAWYAYLQVKEQ